MYCQKVLPDLRITRLEYQKGHSLSDAKLKHKIHKLTLPSILQYDKQQLSCDQYTSW